MPVPNVVDVDVDVPIIIVLPNQPDSVEQVPVKVVTEADIVADGIRD